MRCASHCANGLVTCPECKIHYGDDSTVPKRGNKLIVANQGRAKLGFHARTAGNLSKSSIRMMLMPARDRKVIIQGTAAPGCHPLGFVRQMAEPSRSCAVAAHETEPQMLTSIRRDVIFEDRLVGNLPTAAIGYLEIGRPTILLRSTCRR